jgi:hypothetical protein
VANHGTSSTARALGGVEAIDLAEHSADVDELAAAGAQKAAQKHMMPAHRARGATAAIGLLVSAWLRVLKKKTRKPVFVFFRVWAHADHVFPLSVACRIYFGGLCDRPPNPLAQSPLS